MSSTSHTFPRRLRLVRPGEYKKVFAKARRLGSPSLTVLAIKNQLPHPRLGLVVSRKCDPTAVGRNRLKRLIRETFRHEQHRLNGVDVVVLPGPTAKTRTNKEIIAELAGHWRDLSRWTKY